MKKIIMSCFFLLISAKVYADYAVPSKEELIKLLDEKYEIKRLDAKCDSLSEIAKITMKARQNGLPIIDQLSTVNSDTFPPDMKIKEKFLIYEAYSFPLLSDGYDKNKVVQEFSLKTFLECRKKGMNERWILDK